MLQNLKVDIIYHLTNSDFEMEFNMCGCCRMRLLSDKTADKKSLIGALSRAVSRSRIIIACGPLFSADGLISTVATAIGSKTEAVDNAAYGINGEETINIIAGSTPLVTPEGYFGGCIIESGPQTIILLTENRAFRKSIMQTLIHPYIEEMSVIPVKERSAPAPAQSELIVQTEPEAVEEIPNDTDFEPASMKIIEEFEAEAEEEITEEEAIEETEESEAEDELDCAESEEPQDEALEEIADEAEEEPMKEADEVAEDTTEECDEPQESKTEYIVDDEPSEPAAEREIPFVFDDKNEETQMKELSEKIVDAYDTMYIEPERPKHSHTDKYAASYTPTEENDSFLSDTDFSLVGGSKKRAGAINIPIIILSVILLVIVGLLCYFLIVVPRLQDISTVEYLREIFDTVNTTVYI